MTERRVSSSRVVRTVATVGLLAVVAAMLWAGRGINPATVLPRLQTDGDRIHLSIDFETAVNVPVGALVKLRGNEIGSLQSIDLARDVARLHVTVEPDVRLPRGTRAELRQTTMLGDIYVALMPPKAGDARTGTLGDGDVIGVRDTDPGPQIEEIIVNIAEFMSGGSLLRAQDALRDLNRSVAGQKARLPEISALTARNLSDLADSTDELDRMIADLKDSTTQLAADPVALGYTVGPDGQFRTNAVLTAVNHGFNIIAGVSPLASGLLWALPRLQQLAPFMNQVVPMLRTYSSSPTIVNGNLGDGIDVVTGKVLPFLTSGAGVQVDGVRLDGNDVTQSTAAVLRMIGALR